MDALKKQKARPSPPAIAGPRPADIVHHRKKRMGKARSLSFICCAIFIPAEASSKTEVRHAIAVGEAGGGGPPSTWMLGWPAKLLCHWRKANSFVWPTAQWRKLPAAVRMHGSLLLRKCRAPRRCPCAGCAPPHVRSPLILPIGTTPCVHSSLLLTLCTGPCCSLHVQHRFARPPHVHSSAMCTNPPCTQLPHVHSLAMRTGLCCCPCA